ncbi:MAG: hypothetical protein ACRDPO_02620 [Streptosporangiaceae bacterium]
MARANPVVAAWRWRYELGAAAGLATPWIALRVAAATGLMAGLAAGLVLTASFPRGRRFLAARLWCIVSPHRIRSGCAQAWIHSRYGKLPVILMTRSQPLGERIYVWCRAGIGAADFSSARDLLAAACMATDVHVSRHSRRAHLVALDVIRREPPAEWTGRPSTTGLDQQGLAAESFAEMAAPGVGLLLADPD